MWTVALLACRPPAPDAPPPTATASPTTHTDGHGLDSGHSGAHSAVAPEPPFDGPLLLSEAGLYADLPAGTLAPGLIETSPRYPLWSDGAEKRRWLWVPPGGSIDTTDPDDWVFPVGTVAFKEFRRDGLRIETRRIEKRADGWSMVSYLWRDDESDADAVPSGAPDARGTTHDVPSQLDCQRCHVGPADLLLGVGAIQSDDALQATLPLSAPVPATVPGDEPTRLALGYLHGNCGGCHRPGALGGDRTGLFLDVAVGLPDPSLAAAVVSGVGLEANHEIGGTTVAIVPGDPAASQLWYRMSLRGLEGMPPIGTEATDPAGLAWVDAWIRALPSP